MISSQVLVFVTAINRNPSAIECRSEAVLEPSAPALALIFGSTLEHILKCDRAHPSQTLLHPYSSASMGRL
jgi:hypothetical protein